MTTNDTTDIVQLAKDIEGLMELLEGKGLFYGIQSAIRQLLQVIREKDAHIEALREWTRCLCEKEGWDRDNTRIVYINLDDADASLARTKPLTELEV